MDIQYIVTSSKRYENEVRCFGPFTDLEKAQDFTLELAKRLDDCAFPDLDDNDYLDTRSYTFSITPLNDPEVANDL